MPIRSIACILILALANTLSFAEGENEMYTPAQSLAKIKVPEGFKVTLFAGEPDVVQPIAFTIDDRGRLWVVENLSYPKWQETGRDRISIYEDTDGDGKFDKKTIFWDEGRYLSGIQIGFGGVYICNAPDLSFIPDANGDDIPDGPPQVLLDGWSTKGKHNVLNALKWGPDGWLYGCNGITAPSKVGKPGTSDDKRITINCGVWRYHPTKHTFEVVAHGTTNPWGLDWDQYGQLFVTNCVIKHIFHITPGGHYERMFGEDVNKYSYGLIQSCADHQHWAEGTKWTDSRGGKGAHDAAGGGHAHAGLMIYQGDNWPTQYRGKAFISNVHGGRINCDTLTPKGSGYVATHDKDFLFANDSWFRGLEMQYGPDGSVYMTDWHDTGECHDYDKAEVTTGRIYRITYGDVKPVNTDLSKADDDALIDMQFHANQFFAQHARRILQERAHAGKLRGTTLAAQQPRLLKLVLDKNAPVPHRLNSLWTLKALGPIDEDTTDRLLGADAPAVRYWTIQLAFEEGKATEWQTEIVASLGMNRAPVVRLAAAAAMQRVPVEKRWPFAEMLASAFAEDSDPMLTLMIWYGIEPAVAQDKDRALKLAASTKLPVLRQYIARRVAALSGEKKDEPKKDAK
ncbi:MAG: PVC-type heme-binding CxxCH protein [Phycisphaeraceae bacterium]